MLRYSRIAVLVLGLVLLSVLGLRPVPVHAAGNTYYISATSPNNPGTGTLADPFRRIQSCAAIAMAGDTCSIEGGTYGETVTPANSGTSTNPIKFVNYNGQSVTVAGDDPVTGNWTSCPTPSVCATSGSYYTPITLPLGTGNQVFFNGEMGVQARYPKVSYNADNSPAFFPGSFYLSTGPANNTSPDNTLVDTTSGELSTLNGTTLTNDNIWYVGGKRYNGRWVGEQSTINSFDSTTETLHVTAPYLEGNNSTTRTWYDPQAHDRFYIFGALNLLTADKDWYYDSTLGRLYVRYPQGQQPPANSITVKKRTIAFDLRGSDTSCTGGSYIQVTGINIHAATLLIGKMTVTGFGSSKVMTENWQCNGDVVDSITAKYISHDENSYYAFEAQYYNTGIQIVGNNNIIKNSQISFSSGNGIYILDGTGNSIVNTMIHDVDYGGSYAEGIKLGNAVNTLISHNTIYNSGRGGIALYDETTGARNSQVEYNDVAWGGFMVNDFGMISSFNDDLGGTEIDHNWFHDNQAEDFAVGIYPDSGSATLVIDYNAVWHTDGTATDGKTGVAIELNTPQDNTLVYNNTFYNDTQGFKTFGIAYTDELTGGRIINNIFTGPANYGAPPLTTYAAVNGFLQRSNVVSTAASLFASSTPGASNFLALSATSPALQAGESINSITPVGVSNPDAGAYPSGGTYWTPGASPSNPPNPFPTFTGPVTPDHRNRVANPSFETYTYSNNGYTLNSWTVNTQYTGPVTVVATPYGNYSVFETDLTDRTGQGSVQLGDTRAAQIYQTVTGLSPNTFYKVTGWARPMASGDYVTIGVSGNGALETSQSITYATTGSPPYPEWQKAEAWFHTGPTNTSATIYAYKAAGTTYAYVDDFSLTQLAEQPGHNNANVLGNPGFETGDTTSWFVWGPGTPTAQSSVVHSGSWAGKVGGRTAAWQGAAQNVASTLLADGAGYYLLTAYVRLGSGTAMGAVSFAITDSNGIHYASAYTDVNSTGWTRVSNFVYVTWTGTLVSGQMGVQSSDTGDLYVDDASMTKVMPQYDNNLVDNMSFENNGVAGWSTWGGTCSPNPCNPSLSVDATTHNLGLSSAKTTARGNPCNCPWAGPNQDVTNLLIASGQGTYSLSAFEKLGSGTGTGQVGLKLVDGSGIPRYIQCSSGIDSSYFANVYCQQSITWTGTLTSATIYADTAADSTADLWVDDVELFKVT